MISIKMKQMICIFQETYKVTINTLRFGSYKRIAYIVGN